MTVLLDSILALVLSSVASSLLTWVSLRTGIFLDRPDARKVHAEPVPRCGGIAVFLGSVVPLVSQDSAFLIGFAAGGLLLVLFGVVDDYRGLDYRLKFVGQIAACLVMMRISGLSFASLGEVLPGVEVSLGPVAAACWTVFFLVAVINAVNFTDGLDGLAGGTSLLILASTALLAFLAGDRVVLLVALCTVGGIIGFLRLNMHPARLFMGDAGSQFLGYTVGVCLIGLTQRGGLYGPLLPLLLAGTPLLDMITVVCLRLLKKVSPFRPDKRHLHHHLLALGLSQAQCVPVIYGMNVCILALAISGRFLRDYALLGLFLMLAAAALSLGLFFEFGTRARGRLAAAVTHFFRRPFCLGLPQVLLDRSSCLARMLFLVGLAGLFLMTPAAAARVPAPAAWGALGLAALLSVLFRTGRSSFWDVAGGGIYLLLLYTVYSSTYLTPPDRFCGGFMNLFYGCVAVGYCSFVVFSTEHGPLNWASILLLATASLALVVPAASAGPLLRTALLKVLLIGLSVNALQSLPRTKFLRGYLLAGSLYASLTIFARGLR